MKAIKAYRVYDSPVGITTQEPSYVKVDDCGMVATVSGPMQKVKIATTKVSRTAIYDPSCDVMLIVGYIPPMICGNKRYDRRSVYFWRDQYYTTANDGDGTPYYYNKCYLLCPVSVSGLHGIQQ